MERGASTAADEREELEERVSAYLAGVVPDEYCRDAPPKTAVNHTEDRENPRGLLLTTGKGGSKTTSQPRYDVAVGWIAVVEGMIVEQISPTSMQRLAQWSSCECKQFISIT